MTNRIRWSMLISHHPPSDYDHTISIKGLRICARCFGLYSGIVITYLLKNRIALVNHSFLVIISVLFPFPAVADFLTHELALWKSSNLMRFITGTVLGSAIGIYITFIIAGDGLAGTILIFWLLLLEFGAALTLKHTKRLEVFINRYQISVNK